MASQNRLRIQRRYSVVAHSPDVVELRFGVWNPTSFTLTDESKSGKLFEMVMGLDGSVGAGELAKKINVPRSEVEALIDHLDQLGVIESSASTALDDYLDSLVPSLGYVDGPPRVSPPVILLGDPDLTFEIHRYLGASLPGHQVSVIAHDDPTWLALCESDVSWLMNGLEYEKKMPMFAKWEDCFIIFATKVINPVQLRTLNRITLEHRIPWLHAAIDGPFVLIGPTFVPQGSACYECFETRVAMNLRENASYQKYKEAIVRGQVKDGSMPLQPILSGLLASHAALEALNFIRTACSRTVGKVLAIYLPVMEFTFNEVLRLPGCPACAPQPGRDDKELYFDMRILAGAVKSGG